MITQEEFTALAQLLQRTPMSMAEAQWTQLFLVRLQAVLIQQKRAADEARRGTQGVPEPEQIADDEVASIAVVKEE